MRSVRRSRALVPEPTDRDDAALGGAEGYAQLVCPDGTVLRPEGATTGLPMSAQARAIALAGTGEALSSTSNSATFRG